MLNSRSNTASLGAMSFSCQAFAAFSAACRAYANRFPVLQLAVNDAREGPSYAQCFVAAGSYFSVIL
jgi:hypothetical protein